MYSQPVEVDTMETTMSRKAESLEPLKKRERCSVSKMAEKMNRFEKEKSKCRK